MKKVLPNIIPILALCFAIFIGGYFLGKHSTSPVMITQSKIAPAQDATDSDRTATEEPKVIDGKININTAAKEELTLIPGLGDKLAQRIIDYRELNGPYNSIDELDRVEGFGPARIQQLSKFITAGGSS